MNELLWITQGIIVLFISEQYLRQNDKWDMVFKYLEKGSIAFINWRSDADIIHEMRIIPNLFSKIALLTLLMWFIVVSLKINNEIIMKFIMALLIMSIAVVFSFRWVFNHKETIKEFKPIMYVYGLIILVGIGLVGIFPHEFFMYYRDHNIQLPKYYEMALIFGLYLLVMFLSFYVFMWCVTLIFPISILLLLFSTSKISIFIRKKLNKKSLVGLVGIFQFIVLYGMYKNS